MLGVIEPIDVWLGLPSPITAWPGGGGDGGEEAHTTVIRIAGEEMRRDRRNQRRQRIAPSFGSLNMGAHS
jgi:hypothetical protein